MDFLCYWGTAFVTGFLPGAFFGWLIWFFGKRSEPMPLYRADIVSFAVPLIVWAVMNKYQWTFARAEHQSGCELVLLGWIWSVAFIARMLIPRMTHKLRFRLAAIHVGSISLLAAVLLALFYC